MATEHDIITHDGIEILIKEVDQNQPLYTAHSNHPLFIEIFKGNELEIEGDGEGLEDFISAHVPQRHQAKAMEIVKLILTAI